MAKFGIEGIRTFAHARAAGINVGDLTYTFNRCHGFDLELREARHARTFYLGQTDCWETDIRDRDQGGDDTTYVDAVDLFWIETHGNHTAAGNARMLYDTPHTGWRTYSDKWQLGENFNAEWVMAYSCKTVDRAKIEGLWNIFDGLHLYCGAYNTMVDGPTTDECGEDVADNLISGDTVAEAWMDGVSDWSVDNHPVAVCVGDAATWNDGNIRWARSTINRDHLWGHGHVEPDLLPAQQDCILYRWAEG